MRDLPPVSQSFEHRAAVGTGTATNGGYPSLPGTPRLPRPIPCHSTGSPTIPPRRNHVDADFQPLLLRRQLASQVSFDAPLSPASRPQSPWGRFDPYDCPEVSLYLYVILKLCHMFVTRNTLHPPPASVQLFVAALSTIQS